MARIPQKVSNRSFQVSRAQVINTDGGLSQSIGSIGNDVQAFADRKLQIDQDKENFRTQAAYEKFKIDIQQEYETDKQDIAEDGTGFHDNFGERFKSRREEFLQTVPDRLRDRLSAKLDVDGERFSLFAGRDELAQEKAYQTNSIQNSTQNAVKEIYSNPENVEAIKANTLDLINSSRFTDLEKTKLRDDWSRNARKTQQLALVQRDPNYAAQLTGAVKSSSVASLIRDKEGFRSKPYDDGKTDQNGKRVGPPVYRAGYGSDTYTTADGEVHKVTKDSVVTRADAERDLERRIGEFQETAIQNVGAKAWNRLPDNVQSALTSIAYNYGNLPKRIRESVKSGDPRHIANAVLTLRGDNGGINRKRREEEAEIIRGSKQLSEGTYTLPDTLSPPPEGFPEELSLSDFQEISSSARGILEQVERDQNAADKQRQSERDAAFTQELDQLKFKISDGQAGATEIEQFRDNNIGLSYKDYDSLQTELSQFESRKVDDSRAFGKVADPDYIFNPTNTEDKKDIDTIYKSITNQGDITDEAVAQTAVSFVKRVAAVPKEFEGQIKALIDQNQPALVEQGYDLLDRVYTANPQVAIRDMKKPIIGRYLDYKALQGFLSKEDLLEAVSPASDPLSEGVRTLRAEEAATLLEDVNSADILDAIDESYLPFTEPNLPSDPTVQSRMMLDYKTLYKERYTRTGSADHAQSDAIELMRNRWGKSNANGGQLMRYPIERNYPQVNGSFDWVNKQVKEELYPVIARGKEGDKFRAIPEFTFVATRATEADINAGRPPAYKVMVQDEDGLYNPVFDDNGRELSMRFDPTKYLKAERKKFREKRLNSLEMIETIETGDFKVFR